jgi:hypothetical protein
MARRPDNGAIALHRLSAILRRPNIGTTNMAILRLLCSFYHQIELEHDSSCIEPELKHPPFGGRSSPFGLAASSVWRSDIAAVLIYN